MWLEDQDEQAGCRGEICSSQATPVPGSRAFSSILLTQLLPPMPGSGGLLWTRLDPVTLPQSKTRTVEAVAEDNGLR